MNPFETVCRPGKIDRKNVFVKIRFDGRELSITGVIAPTRRGDADCCGQITDELSEITDFGPGWDAKMVKRLQAIWERWHLNGMRAGTKRQQKILEANADKLTGFINRYGQALEILEDAGAQPDRELPGINQYVRRLKEIRPDEPVRELIRQAHETGYSYGSQWLFEPVPEKVQRWLFECPETDIEPAWV